MATTADGQAEPRRSNKRATMIVPVKFMGELPAIIGQRTLAVTLPLGATVGDLLDSLSRSYGDAFRLRVFAGPASLQHTTLIFVNGEDIDTRGGLAVPLDERGVEVVVVPMLCGG